MSDQAQVLEIIANVFAAVTACDQVAFSALLQDDFMIHENGQRFDASGIFDLISKAQLAGAVFDWNVLDAVVHISGDLASVAYRNSGAVTRDGTRQPVEWLETATLVRTHGSWRVAFMMSMRETQALDSKE